MLKHESIMDQTTHHRMRRSDILNILYEDIGTVLHYIEASDDPFGVVQKVSKVIVEDDQLMKRYQSYLKNHEESDDELIHRFQEEIEHCKECR